VNIVLKKHISKPTIDVRYGWFTHGGGSSNRVSFTDGFSKGRFNLIGGIQYRHTNPIWGYQRPLTRRAYRNGTGDVSPFPVTRLLDELKTTNNYVFNDPANCANITGLFDHTTHKYDVVN